VTFNFWSLDYIYYPVSGIMWVWHKIFGALFGLWDSNSAANPWVWILSVVFLVFTLRAILFKPFLKQMDSQIKMQAIQPEMKRLREKYKDDRQRLSEEMMKLNKEAGVNPLSSCLPALMQAPVFLALYHVLKSFKPGWGQVYFFGKTDVDSFVDARLFGAGPNVVGGAPLSSFMAMPTNSTPTQVGLMDLFGDRATVIAVAVPLSILAAIATHLTSRRSVARQIQMNPESANNPQTKIMNKLMLYIFPLGVLVFGIFFPIANLFYWLSNNSWTFAQLWFVHRMQDRKAAAEAKIVEEAKEAAKFTKPAVGAKPRPGQRPVVQAKRIDAGPSLSKDGAGSVDVEDAAVTDAGPIGNTGSSAGKGSANGSAGPNGSASGNGSSGTNGASGGNRATSGNSAGTGNTPRPGARPQNRSQPRKKRR
jgi:YidC/Oxa1 family membrane protein insertase